MPKLNVGCGPLPFDGWVNIDISPERNPDIVADARDLPFEDDSVDEIYCGHLIEHLFYPHAIEALKEMYRVLKPGGTIWVIVPNLRRVAELYLNGQCELPGFIAATHGYYDQIASPGDVHRHGYDQPHFVELFEAAGVPHEGIPIDEVPVVQMGLISNADWQLAAKVVKPL